MAVRKDAPDDRKRRTAAAPSYSAKDIQVLEGLEAVRRRPGMYIGTTDLRGLHHLVREVLDNSIDEAMNGTCDRIDLWIHKTNEITVADNGIGIAPENLTRIFSHGFTTKRDGHGFGLHSGALAAKEMGGALNAQSDGPGLGATFTLELPLRSAQS